MTGVAIRPKKGEKLARAEYGGRTEIGWALSHRLGTVSGMMEQSPNISWGC